MIRLVHIADIHFSSSSSLLIGKAEIVARAIVSDLPEQTADLLIVVNGDIADRGQTTEFKLAAAFFHTLLRHIDSLKPREVKMHVALNAGNHDCDLSDDQTARDLMIQNLEPARPSSSIEKIILAPLSNYFKFVDEFHGDICVAIRESTPYISTCQLSTSHGQLDLHLINSAWMSQRHEKSNYAAFPLKELPVTRSKSESNGSIAILHHPLNWFRQPDTMTQLRDWIERNCDLLVTGHEHSPRESATISGDLSIAHCEGGAMQQSDSSHYSCFHTLDLDIMACRVQLTRRLFDEHSYCYAAAESRSLPFGNLASLNQPRRFNSEHLNWLQDAELPIQIPNRTHIKLQELFLYPDLNDYSCNAQKRQRTVIPSGRVLETIQEEPRCLLTAADRAGKTTLAKQLCYDLHNSGRIPIYLNALKFKGQVNANSVRKVVAQAVRAQYQTITIDALQQLYANDAVIIIDDLHVLYDRGIRPSEITDQIEVDFKHIVLLASDELLLCESRGIGGEFGGFPDYRKFQICEFGQNRIETLAKKWLSLGEDSSLNDPDKLSKDVQKLSKQIQNVLAADVIPHHPWILIVLLHQSAENESIAVRNGSYGHMYQAIVTAALSRSKMSTLELSGKFSYLAGFAYRVFASGEASLTERAARDFHSEHCSHVDIPLDFDATLADLTKAGILRADESGVRIVSRYATCFFVAWHLHTNLHEVWAKQEVARLCSKLYDPISANTLLFLAHLKPDPFVFDTIQTAASEIFATAPMATFLGDVEKINELGGMSSEISIPHSDPDSNRTKFIEEKEHPSPVPVSESAKDLKLTAIADPSDARSAFVDEMHEIQSAYKMIKILGQMLKNGADSLASDRKIAIVDEVFRLSRRMLGAGFAELEDVDQWRKLTKRRVEARANQKEPKKKYAVASPVTVKELSLRADREIVGICWVACFTIVKVVAEATGARILAGTFEKVIAKDSSIPNQLYQLDVLMEHGADFPLKEALNLKSLVEKNPFIESLFKSLVAHHFYLYKAKYDVKQRVCSRLEIGIDGAKALNSGRKERPGTARNRKRLQ